MSILEKIYSCHTQRFPRLYKCTIYGLLLCLLFSIPPWQSKVHAAKPQYEIKLATLAPENSTLMKIFREMDAELRRETGGRVGFTFFSGFALGDERDVFRKMRIGLVQAATFTATFLNDLSPEMRALQVPFLFDNYQEVDYVLERMSDDISDSVAKRGYQILGWTEVGFIYIMSTVAVHNVADLKGKKVWTNANSPMANTVFNKAQVSPVTIGAPDVLVALQTNLVEIVFNSPYYALITQWYSRVNYVIDLPLFYLGGALIINNKAFSRLPAEYQQSLKQVCSKYLRQLTEKTRKDNEQAIQLIYKRGVKKITPEPADIQSFKDLLNQAMAEIDPKFLPREYLQKVRETVEEYRTRQEEKL